MSGPFSVLSAAAAFASVAGVSQRDKTSCLLTPFLAFGLASQIYLYDPQAYALTHWIAICATVIAFGILVFSQVEAFIRPVSFEARQRVTVLAMGTFASVTPGIVVLAIGAFSGGKAPENFVGCAA